MTWYKLVEGIFELTGTCVLMILGDGAFSVSSRVAEVTALTLAWFSSGALDLKYWARL